MNGQTIPRAGATNLNRGDEVRALIGRVQNSDQGRLLMKSLGFLPAIYLIGLGTAGYIRFGLWHQLVIVDFPGYFSYLAYPSSLWIFGGAILAVSTFQHPAKATCSGLLMGFTYELLNNIGNGYGTAPHLMWFWAASILGLGLLSRPDLLLYVFGAAAYVASAHAFPQVAADEPASELVIVVLLLPSLIKHALARLKKVKVSLQSQTARFLTLLQRKKEIPTVHPHRDQSTNREAFQSTTRRGREP
jgi:hypothetical protein